MSSLSSSFEYFLPRSPLRFRVSSLSFSHFFSPLLTTHWNHFETSTDFATCPRERPSALFSRPGSDNLDDGFMATLDSTERVPRPRTAFKASILINDRGARGKSKWKFHGTTHGLLPTIFLRCSGLTYRVMRELGLYSLYSLSYGHYDADERCNSWLVERNWCFAKK